MKNKSLKQLAALVVFFIIAIPLMFPGKDAQQIKESVASITEQSDVQFNVVSSTPSGCGLDERIVFLKTYNKSQVRSFLEQQVNSQKSLCYYRLDVYQPGKNPDIDASYAVGIWKGKKKLVQIRING